jgi:acetyl-CoA C-acetyltransferase
MKKVVYIVSACRTAIGKFGGALTSFSPAALGVITASEVLKRANLAPEGGVDEVIVGNVLGAGHGMNVARQITLGAKLPVTTPAYSVNKVCGSGLKAITLGVQAIQNGDAELIMAGGTESMSQAPFVSLGTRWGARLGHTELKDLILQDGLTDVFHSCHMGVTAENLSERYTISRAAQDRFAFESQQKATRAIADGKFAEEIVPVPIMERGVQKGVFAQDEYPRADASLEGLAKLKPAFKQGGTVTAGNASGINDGSAMVLLASEEAIRRHGLKPLAMVAGYASAAVAPEVMGIGPVDAVKLLLKRSGFGFNEIECVEANEAFAAQAIAVNRLLEWDTTRVNPNGGAIALGHPIGASGARIVVSLIHEMKRTSAKGYGVATLCVGGGQGIALAVKLV